MYRIANIGVVRLSDGKHIKRGMPEWAEYLHWAKTNIPLPQPVLTPTLGARRQVVFARIDRLRDVKIAEGVVLGPYVFACDPTAIQVITAFFTAFNAGVPLPSNFKWRTKDGQTISVTLPQLGQLLQAMVTRVYQCYVRSWELKDIVVANSNNPEAEPIDTGWPV